MPQAVTGGGTVDVTVTAGTTQIGVIPNVSLSNAVALAAAVCPTAGIDLPTLTNLDNSGTPLAQPCDGMTGLSFSFAQNANVGEDGQGNNGNGGNSGYAPGQNKVEGATPPSANPSTPPGQQGQQTR